MSTPAPPRRPIRLAYLVTHPIQYQAPLLRRIAALPGIELHVFFQSDVSVRTHHDKGFGQEIAWDVPLLEGYASSVLPTWNGDNDRMSMWRPFSRGLVGRLRRERFDVLWVHGYARPFNLMSALAARALGLGVLVRDEVHKLGNPRRPLREAVKRVQLALMSRLGMHFLAIGTLNADYLRSLGVADGRITIAPYAVDNVHFRERIKAAAPEREALRARIGMTDHAPVLLFAGKFIARKRPADLLAAYRQASTALAAAGEPVPWLLYAGSGPLLEEVKIQAADLPRVIFLGFQTQAQLAALFDLCDLFVLPSATEPWGLIVNEVMNAARPVIVTDQSGCGPDLVRQGVNGYIYPTGDVARLAEHLTALCRDPELRRSMGARSLEIISSWDYDADCKALIAALSAVGRMVGSS